MVGRLIHFSSLINVWMKCRCLTYIVNTVGTHGTGCTEKDFHCKRCRWMSLMSEGCSNVDTGPDLCTQAFYSICAPAINIWFTKATCNFTNCNWECLTGTFCHKAVQSKHFSNVTNQTVLLKQEFTAALRL